MSSLPQQPSGSTADTTTSKNTTPRKRKRNQGALDSTQQESSSSSNEKPKCPKSALKDMVKHMNDMEPDTRLPSNECEMDEVITSTYDPELHKRVSDFASPNAHFLLDQITELHSRELGDAVMDIQYKSPAGNVRNATRCALVAFGLELKGISELMMESLIPKTDNDN
ncbi:hypothetical protein BDV06DRAFT_221741 [Aspergillus oleicola]